MTQTSNTRFITTCTRETKEHYKAAMLDAIAKDGKVLVGEITEHIEGGILRLSAYAK